MVDVSRPDTMIAQSVTLFVLAGLCEIGGGYLVWLWLRDHRSVALGVAGGLPLFVYGVLPMLQAAHFGRVHAAQCLSPQRTRLPNVVPEIACLSIDARLSLPQRR